MMPDYIKIVLAKYPQAWAMPPTPSGDPRSSQYEPGFWEIRRFKELGQEAIGIGASEEMAWRNAAARIQAEAQEADDERAD